MQLRPCTTSFKTYEAINVEMTKVLQDYRALATRFLEHAAANDEHVQDIEKGYKETDSDLKTVGRVLGHLTAIQALLRELNPGEIRKQLFQKATKGVAKKAHTSVGRQAQHRPETDHWE